MYRSSSGALWSMSREGGKSGVSQQGFRPKVVAGVILLIVTPVLLFVKPISTAAILRDLALAIWWAFIIWLLVTGFREPKPPVSK
jgi:hypothetical protein